MQKIIFLCFAVILTAKVTGQNDTLAIKQLLEKESSTWREGNVEAHAACWHIQPYSKILVSTTDGKCYNVPPESIVHPSKEMMGRGGKAINSNYLFSIHGNNAWVSHDEQSVSPNGDITYSYEIRMLEKIKGEWKLIGQSIHIHQ